MNKMRLPTVREWIQLLSGLLLVLAYGGSFEQVRRFVAGHGQDGWITAAIAAAPIIVVVICLLRWFEATTVHPLGRLDTAAIVVFGLAAYGFECWANWSTTTDTSNNGRMVAIILPVASLGGLLLSRGHSPAKVKKPKAKARDAAPAAVSRGGVIVPAETVPLADPPTSPAEAAELAALPTMAELARDTPTETLRQRTIRDEILAVLTNHSAGQAEIAREVGIHRSNVIHYLDEMVAEGLLVREDSGRRRYSRPSPQTLQAVR